VVKKTTEGGHCCLPAQRQHQFLKTIELQKKIIWWCVSRL